MKNDTNEKCVLTSVLETELDILKRHIIVLEELRKNQPIGIIKLSEITGYPQHMIRYSLRILEQDGFIEPSPQGAITMDDAAETNALLKKTLKELARSAEEIIKTLE
jgi:predicted transcriptional regulator